MTVPPRRRRPRRGLARWHWTALFGYYGTVVLLATTLWIARDRWGRHDVLHRFSHQTDWLFLGLLVATILSGILMHQAPRGATGKIASGAARSGFHGRTAAPSGR